MDSIIKMKFTKLQAKDLQSFTNEVREAVRMKFVKFIDRA